MVRSRKKIIARVCCERPQNAHYLRFCPDNTVAVCGLPHPNKYHAVTMIRFSKDCILKMQHCLIDLESSLGPGTASLGMRIGVSISRKGFLLGVINLQCLIFHLCIGNFVPHHSFTLEPLLQGCCVLIKPASNCLGIR